MIERYFDTSTTQGKIVTAVVATLVVLIIIMVVLRIKYMCCLRKVDQKVKSVNGDRTQPFTQYEAVVTEPPVSGSISLISHLTRRSSPVHKCHNRSKIGLSDYESNLDSDFAYENTDASQYDTDSIITRVKPVNMPVAHHDMRFEKSRNDGEGQDLLGPRAFRGENLFMN